MDQGAYHGRVVHVRPDKNGPSSPVGLAVGTSDVRRRHHGVHAVTPVLDQRHHRDAKARRGLALDQLRPGRFDDRSPRGLTQLEYVLDLDARHRPARRDGLALSGLLVDAERPNSPFAVYPYPSLVMD